MGLLSSGITNLRTSKSTDEPENEEVGDSFLSDITGEEGRCIENRHAPREHLYQLGSHPEHNSDLDIFCVVKDSGVYAHATFQIPLPSLLISVV